MSTDTQEEGVELALMVFANDKSEQQTEVLRGLLKMVYSAALTNQIAVMEAKNTETGKLEVVLVGVTHGPDGSVNCWPLFLPLRAEDVGKYIAPDGQGGFIGEPEVEVEA